MRRFQRAPGAVSIDILDAIPIASSLDEKDRLIVRGFSNTGKGTSDKGVTQKDAGLFRDVAKIHECSGQECTMLIEDLGVSP